MLRAAFRNASQTTTRYSDITFSLLFIYCGPVCRVRCPDVLLVMPRLDYCNATLAGLPASQLSRMQSVLNAAARLIHRSSRYEHLTPMLRDLHWLRSTERIDFKLAVLTYRCVHGLAPRYLSDYIQNVAVSNRRRLRSSSSSKLVIRRTWLSTVDDAFPVAGCRASGTVCRPTSPQLQRCLFFETASKLISFPDHFLPNCFRFLVLLTVYSSGLAVFVL